MSFFKSFMCCITEEIEREETKREEVKKGINFYCFKCGTRYDDIYHHCCKCKINYGEKRHCCECGLNYNERKHCCICGLKYEENEHNCIYKKE